MDGKLWFGSETHAQWVPCPVTGMARTQEGFSEEIAFDNGGIWIDRSAAGRASFEMEFPVLDWSEYEGLESFARFASGEWGTGWVRFIDPMITDQNLFTPNWAAPGLAEVGWKPVYDTTPTYSATGANSYQKPPRKAVYNVTSAANAVPTGQNSVFTLLIPPTHTLSIGGSGAVTGTAVLRVQPVNLNGTLATPVDITLTADSAAPAFSSTFSGATYKAVRVYVTRTTTATSTITLTSLWAQMVKTGFTPAITRHIPGKGHTGLSFRGDANPVTYVMADRHLVGASIVLVETEAWA